MALALRIAIPTLPTRDLGATAAFDEGWASPQSPGAAARVARGSRGAPRLRGPPQDTDDGLREFALVDPDGNLVRVGSPAGVSPAA
jgi:hypothetical protein